MKIFLDTANLESIKKFNDMGLLDGITTNPSLMSKEGGNPKDAMEEITKIIQGDVSLEVVSTDYSGMMEEGRLPREYGNNVVTYVCELQSSDCESHLIINDRETNEAHYTIDVSHEVKTIKSGTRISLSMFGRRKPGKTTLL